MISASALPLLVNCAAPAHPDTWLAPDKMGAPARFGNAVHLLAEWYLGPHGVPAHGVKQALKACGVDEDEQPRLERVWANLREWIYENSKPEWRAEIAYAYDPVTQMSRVLGEGIGREYTKAGLLHGEVAGTADVASVRGACATVYDYKTGKSDADSYRWQMRQLGLAAAREAGTIRACVIVVRVNEVEVDDSWEEVLQPDDLDDVAAEVLRIHEEAKVGTRRAGSHCETQYCRGRNKCDAYREWRK